ncbi:MAG: hypothetical protein QOD51_2248 [Candidatus Eremiobacteraeota bacterium]|jgi:hypothetical protein|nr:hypothetical protein [Candidatus Eremiobacteraeota bacterium]
MTHESPPTVRPDLIGKTVVFIVDPRTHGDGRFPPRAILGEIIDAEEDYAAVRCLGTTSGMSTIPSFDLRMPFDPEYELLEPGKMLDEYLPGYRPMFGNPDHVWFQGKARERWQHERDTRADS